MNLAIDSCDERRGDPCRTLELLASNGMREWTMAAPAIANETMVIRTRLRLDAFATSR